jgi:hypothetical protein
MLADRRNAMPFVRGESGNPAGRPPGARNRKSLLVEAMLDAESESLGRRMIERALDGDAGALRMCMERVLPRGRDRAVPYALPPIETAADARRAATMISVAIGTGELTPREAMDLVRVVEKCGQIVAAAEAAEREARRAEESAGMRQSLQDELNRRLVEKALTRAAAFNRMLAADEADDGGDDGGGAAPAERVPAAGAQGAADATGQAGAAQGQEAVGGKNNARGNNKNTMARDAALPSVPAAPWPLAAPVGGVEAWACGPLVAVPRGLRQRVADLLGSSAMGGMGGAMAMATAAG